MKILRHLLLFLCLAAFSRGEEGPQNVAQLFQTPENLEIVTSPEWVDVCMLYPKKPWFSRKHPTKYREGSYKKLSPAEASLLSTKLSEEKTYLWDYKFCMPTYNARIRFHRANHVIAADFCFGCDIVRFSKDGQFFSGGNFDHASDEIFEAVRSNFPNDKVVAEITKLKEARKMSRAQIEEITRRQKEEKNKSQRAVSESSAAP